MKDENAKTDWLNEAIYTLNRPWLLGLALAFVFVPTATISEALESGADFLKIDTDARVVSMGSAYTAAAQGVNSIAYNPAGLATLKGVEFGFSHTNWLMDSKHDFISIGMPVKTTGGLLPGDKWFVGLALTRLTSGGMESRNADRSAGGGFSAYDQSVSIALAKNMGSSRFGVAAKYIESSIAGQKAASAAMDFGVTGKLGALPASLGLAVQNLGAPMKFIDQKDPLPLTVSAGLLASVMPGFDVALDVRQLVHDQQTDISLGTEYNFVPNLALRTGYMMNTRLAGAGNRGFSMGAGVNVLDMQIDYSVMPFGEIGNAQKITLKKRF